MSLHSQIYFIRIGTTHDNIKWKQLQFETIESSLLNEKLKIKIDHANWGEHIEIREIKLIKH